MSLLLAEDAGGWLSEAHRVVVAMGLLLLSEIHRLHRSAKGYRSVGLKRGLEFGVLFCTRAADE